MAAFRIGIITGGGDCPGLNAVIRAVTVSAISLGWEVMGFSDGFEGLVTPVRYKALTRANTEGIMHLGGTILGSSNRGRFSAKVGMGETVKIPQEIIDESLKTIQELQIGALVCVGGDGSLTIALQLQEAGISLVGVPKTIDNDLSATAMTFGFDSAVQCVTDALDRLHTTAQSHRRVMVVEVMGRHAGWIALWGGIAGGANIILIPEIPFEYEKIFQYIRNRISEGSNSTMVVVAEGAFSKDGFVVAGKNGSGGEIRLGGIGHQVTEYIEKYTGRESRTVVLGHLQRGGQPTTLDRILGTRFGEGAVELIKQEKFGQMVSYLNYQIGSVPIQEAVGQLKLVDPESQLVKTARAIGISFGN